MFKIIMFGVLYIYIYIYTLILVFVMCIRSFGRQKSMLCFKRSRIKNSKIHFLRFLCLLHIYLTLQTNTTVGNGKIHCTTRKFHGGIIQLCKPPTWPEEYHVFLKLMGIVEFIPLVASLYRYIFVWYWFSLFIVEKLVGIYLYLHLYVCIFFIWAG